MWECLLFSKLTHIVNYKSRGYTVNYDEKDILGRGIEILKSLFERHGFGISNSIGQANPPWDAVIEDPSHKKMILVEVKSNFFPSQIDQFASSLDANIKGQKNSIPLIITPNITASSFEHCIKNKINVLDLNGNILLDIPGFSIERFNGGRITKRPPSSGTVFTAKGSRLLRAMLAFPKRDWTHSELVRATKVSAGYVSIQINKMNVAGYTVKSGNLIRLVEPDKLLDDWCSHYRFDRYRKRHFYAISDTNYEHGLATLSKSLKKAGVTFAFTGWSGAYIRAPYATSNTYIAYVDHFPAEMESIFPIAADGNVILYLPQDEGVFQFLSTDNKYGPVVSDTQLYLDLSKMPGRAKDQAEHLRAELLKWENS